ncbi:MAG: glycosyl hydrolase family 28 protein, partial [Candidatus Bathyarchaeia archaeon]
MSCVKPSEAYKLKKDGKEIPVYDVPVASIANFNLEDECKITIKTNRDIKWVDIRPLRLNIKPSFHLNEVKFLLNQPCQISVELNRDPSTRPLFLFANSPEERVPDKNDPDTIYFEPHKIHEAGNIPIESGQTVYIDEGAIVEGLIDAENAEDIRIAGRGILDGTRVNEWKSEKKWQRLIHLQDSQKIKIEDITIVNSQTWQIVPINCNQVNINNVKIVSDNGSDDGIDIVRSKNVKIQECFIRSKDDCIADR